MLEFVKPMRKSIKVSEGFAELLGKELFKDLAEHEGICPQCHGTGMVVRNHPYGLEGDPDKKVGVFPYNHQSIIPCPNCYNGVVRYCPDCGKQLKRSYLKCDCESNLERMTGKCLRQALSSGKISGKGIAAILEVTGLPYELAFGNMEKEV